MLARENYEVPGEKPVPLQTLSTTNPTYRGQGSNPVLRGERSKSKHLSAQFGEAAGQKYLHQQHNGFKMCQ
jgi:hypothetical protein